MKVKLLHKSSMVPERQSIGAAGYDLHAAAESIIYPGSTASINVGIAVEIPHGCVMLVMIRSSLALARLSLATGVSVIDSDYRGPIMLPILNYGDDVYTIKAGARIAQAVIVHHETEPFSVVDVLSPTARGAGGFGSTGK